MLEQLVPNIQRTADLVQEISAATREQNIGAEQINEAIRNLDGVIRENADSARSAAATSEALATESEKLRAMVGFFSKKSAPAPAPVARSGPIPARNPTSWPPSTDLPRTRGAHSEMPRPCGAFPIPFRHKTPYLPGNIGRHGWQNPPATSSHC